MALATGSVWSCAGNMVMNEVLDHKMLEELRLIMEEDFPLLMDTFLTDSARQFDELEKAFQCSDMEALHRTAHGLKGSCGNVGATLLQEACAKLENCARHGEQNELSALVANVSNQLRLVCDAIRAC